jgi:hypothetical protein
VVSRWKFSSELSGDATTRAGSWTTVNFTVSVNSPCAATMFAVPSAAAVTRPASLTVATAALVELHAIVAPGMALAFPSRTTAESCLVSPRAPSVTVSCDAMTLAGVWMT